jgi:large subunit ribosomal protein L4
MPENKSKIKSPTDVKTLAGKKKLKVKSAADKTKTKKAVEKKPVAKRTDTKNLSAPMYDVKGAKNGTFALPKEIFGAKVNDVLMAQAVRVYLANQRQGNAHTKSRGEVDLTTAKWFRQKGTGRARHGAKSAPIFVGGGVAHGPKKRDFSLSLPKKMKKAALLSALSQKANDGEVIVLSGFSKIEPKTKIMNKALIKITEDKENKNKLLIVTAGTSKDVPNVFRAGKNIKNVDLISANLINTYEVLKHKNLLVMKESVDLLIKNGGYQEKN